VTRFRDGSVVLSFSPWCVADLNPLLPPRDRRHRGTAQGRITLEAAAGDRRAIIKPRVAGYVNLATPRGTFVSTTAQRCLPL